jgi:hypothetical protein
MMHDVAMTLSIPDPDARAPRRLRMQIGGEVALLVHRIGHDALIFVTPLCSHELLRLDVPVLLGVVLDRAVRAELAHLKRS